MTAAAFFFVTLAYLYQPLFTALTNDYSYIRALYAHLNAFTTNEIERAQRIVVSTYS